MGDTRIIDQQEIRDIWTSCYGQFETFIDKATFEMVIKSVQPTATDQDTVELLLPRVWQRDKLEKYIGEINDVYNEKVGRNVCFKLKVGSNGSGDKQPHIEVTSNPPIMETDDETSPSDIPRKPKSRREMPPLDPKYTFSTFIVGSSNRIAAAAAEAVAEAPASAYNPFFIYGGVGLGKTHLLHAIAHRVLKDNPEARVVYVSAENFMNDLVESIQEKRMKIFRKKYRNTKVFLIDDIQFIKNKETMQEEFFHTFNELHGAKSQIVITSDRPPKNIPTLEDRLRSRFEWGLIADIQPPELETRMAILKKKSDMEKLDVPIEVINFIAEKVPSNIRELEGALNRVICVSSLLKQPVGIDLAIHALKDILPDSRSKHLSVTSIQEKVCEYYGVSLEDLVGSRRDSKLVVPRHMAMYLSREMLGSSYPSIGKAFGGRDHTTIMNACNNIKKKKRTPSLRNDMDNLKNMLKSTGG